MSEITRRADRAEMARRVERAEKLLQKGKTVEALQEYLQVLRDDPENDVIRQLAADLCLSLSRNQEAVALLGEVFERQVKASDATRASLTYKKLARYGTPTWEQKFHFGKLLEGTNKKLAMGTYEAALEDLATLNKKQESLQVLDRIVTLDPSLANFLRLAEVSSETGHGKASAVAFQRVAQLTAAEGGDPAQWYERAYQEHSSDAEISLAYGKSLLAQGQVGAAIFILEPQVNAENATLELRDTYSQVLMAAGRYAEAEPLVWQLFEQNPTRMDQVISVIGQLLDSEQEAAAVALARKLEQFQRRRGERRQFLTIMQDITAAHRASAEMLEFLSELYNASNRENDYCQTLLKLFDLYCSTADFAKAAECLDRAAEVDPYEPGHMKRLDMLKGKIDENRYKVIASRFTAASKPVEESAQADGQGSTLGASTLQDLMLQAEILVQYGMRNKAVERLQRIQELFPREEERNEDLQRLYLAAGVTPHYAGSAPLPPAVPAVPASAGAPAVPPPQVSSPTPDVRSFTRVAEITRKLYHQGTAAAVLTTAAKEIGAHWETTRCVAATGKPGHAPSAVEEHCAEGVMKGSPSALAEIAASLQDAAGTEPLIVQDAQKSPQLQAIRQVLAELNATSLLVIPLSDGEEPVGVLVLVHNKPRVWQQADVVVLKTLAEQMVIALNNVGLRRLVKNLSVTDEKSGLLKRASYIDLLLAESKRAIQNAAPLSLVLLQFGRSAAMVKEHGEAEVGNAMARVGQLFAANIRSNDLAFRYDTTTIAIILGDTAEKEATKAIEKLRKIVSEVRLPGKDGADGQPFAFSAGLAEAVVRQEFDAVDIVTEVINRD